MGGRKEYVMGNSITCLSKCSCPIALHCPNGYQQSVVRGILIGLPKGGPRLALAGASMPPTSDGEGSNDMAYCEGLPSIVGNKCDVIWMRP